MAARGEKEMTAPYSEERGYAVATASGKLYYPLKPDPAEIHIFDIGVQLSRICRFNGALRPDIPGIYSVAQHLVHASYMVPQHLALEALLHDAHEAYIHDIVKPFKMMLEDYQAFEEVSERALRKAFGLPAKMSPEVKDADRRLFAAEVRDLVDEGYGAICQGLPEAPPMKIVPWTPMRARTLFLARYEEVRRD